MLKIQKSIHVVDEAAYLVTTVDYGPKMFITLGPDVEWSYFGCKEKKDLV